MQAMRTKLENLTSGDKRFLIIDHHYDTPVGIGQIRSDMVDSIAMGL
jgi:hypothetical protein